MTRPATAGTVPLTDEDIARLALHEFADTVASRALRDRVHRLVDGLLAGDLAIVRVDEVDGG